MKLLSLAIGFVLIFSGCTSQGGLADRDIEVFFVADSPRSLLLYSEVRLLEVPPQDQASWVVSQLVSGAIQPLDPDYVNLWDQSHALNELSIAGNTATVDLALGKLNVGSEAEQRAIDQIVWTLGALEPSVEVVRFLVNGVTVESFAGHVDTSAEFGRVMDDEVLSPVQVVSPHEGAELGSSVTISGTACVFEANVTWGLFQGGALVAEGFATAEAACPERSGWNVKLSGLEPGNYLFKAQELSAEDGSVLAEDTKFFVVN
jgi:hypothetical protein